MAEYIEREDLLELYRMDDPVLNENGHVPLPVIRQNIMDIPAADVVPMRHGRWNDSLARITPYCSACGHSHRCLIKTPNYCPNCGAKTNQSMKKPIRLAHRFVNGCRRDKDGCYRIYS